MLVNGPSRFIGDTFFSKLNVSKKITLNNTEANDDTTEDSQRGYFIQTNGVSTGSWTTDVIGAAGTNGINTLTLGNNLNNQTADNAYGKLRIYDVLGKYADIRADSNQDNTVWLPSLTAGTSYTLVARSGSGSVGGSSRHIYIDSDGIITAATYTANRLYYTSSTSAFTAGTYYANGTKIAINSTSAPTANLYVNGTTETNNKITINTGDTANSLGFYLQQSTQNYGRFYINTIGTTSATGLAILQIGNELNDNTNKNAKGVLRIYGTDTTYVDISGSTSNSIVATGSIIIDRGTSAAVGDGFYLKDNTQNYARLYIKTKGTASATGVATLQLGNSVAAGQAKNASGELVFYDNAGTNRTLAAVNANTYYGNLTLGNSGKNGYYGITIGTDNDYMTVMCDTGGVNQGLYNKSDNSGSGKWLFYYNKTNSHVSINGGDSSSTFGVTLHGTADLRDVTRIGYAASANTHTTYNGRTIPTSSKLFVNGGGFFNGNVEVASGIHVHRTTNDGGYYLGANNVYYGRLYISKIGTTNTTEGIGGALLQLGNGTASGTANNAQGIIRIYGTDNSYTDLYGTAKLGSGQGQIVSTGNIVVDRGDDAHLGDGIYIRQAGTVYSRWYITQLGTTSSGGSALFQIGNSNSSNEDKNAKGIVRIYGTDSTCTDIAGTDGSDGTGQLTVGGYLITQMVRPDANQSWDLGTNGYKWNHIYGAYVHTNNLKPSTNQIISESAENYDSYFTVKTPTAGKWAVFRLNNSDKYWDIATNKNASSSGGVSVPANALKFDYNGSGGSNGVVYISTSEVLYGAAWNDYAEFRKTTEDIEPGRCVREVGDDTLELTTKRLERGCEIVSDTFGFAIGQTNDTKTPTAATGRVLAYIYEGRKAAAAHIGWPVCSGPDGTVSIMTEEEEEKYPSRIIGTISAVPDYDVWHGGNDVEVKGRVWIRIR